MGYGRLRAPSDGVNCIWNKKGVEIKKTGRLTNVCFWSIIGLAFKNRPILVLKVENEYGNTDVTAIPVSKVTDAKRIIVGYDIKVEKQKYPLLNLKENVSYFRTSKVTTINSGSIGAKHISNLRKEYPALFDEIVNKVKNHINKIGGDL